MVLELRPLHVGAGEIRPAVTLRDRLLLPGHRGTLVRHLEEEKLGQLFEVILV